MDLEEKRKEIVEQLAQMCLEWNREIYYESYLPDMESNNEKPIPFSKYGNDRETVEMMLSDYISEVAERLNEIQKD